MKMSRRDFLKIGAFGSATLALPFGMIGCPTPVSPTGILDPQSIQKYRMPLIIPPVMPQSAKSLGRKQAGIDYYEIAVRQFQQAILPPPWPQTTVWSYGAAAALATFNYPAFTIEAQWDTPLRVKWINQLVDGAGHFLKHLLPIDQTLHWANPPGGVMGRDMETLNPAAYQGPVPMVAHVHGAHTLPHSDGYPAAWFLPAASDIPSGYATEGTWYDTFKAQAEADTGQVWEPGSAVFQYPNDQRATTLWYHDHSLGMTRANVYAGPAGFYLLRGGPDDAVEGLPGPAPRAGDPAGAKYYEIPIVIQDRTFNYDGSFFYPDSRKFFDGFEGPYVPDSDIAPIWNSEFFANTMVVNGRTWPYLEVEPRRYRFRWLNGCNSRFLWIRLLQGSPDMQQASALIPFWQIGSDGGFLPRPVRRESMLMAPAERMDTVVDFTGLPAGTEIYLTNEGPDDPFGGGVPDVDFDPADPLSTGQVMKFIVVPLAGQDTSLPANQLSLPSVPRLGAAAATRDVSLNELESAVLEGVGPRISLLGTVADGPLRWKDPVTENPNVGDVEFWKIHNTTQDAHPIHLHQVQFEIVERTDADGLNPTPPDVGENGRKDTVVVYPGGVTTVKAEFDIAGRYVWHCHILEHEDNEMMRPYHVGPIPPEP